MEKIKRIKVSQIDDATNIDGFKALGIKVNTDGTVDNVKVPMDLLKGNIGDPFTYEDFTPAQIEDLQRPALEAVQNLAVNFQKLLEFLQIGYWVHKNTGATTYFGLDDPSIVGGIMSSPSWKDDCSEVKIPVGVTGLGNNCFSDCLSLTSITLPVGVTSLGDSCFNFCRSLSSITIPEGVTSISHSCFSFCRLLTSVTIPESVTSIGDYCFRFCSNLSLATVLPATPPSLGASAFSGTSASFNIEVRSPYVNDYKSATNWTAYADKIFSMGEIIFEDPEVGNILHTNGLISYPDFSTEEELAGITNIYTIFQSSEITSFDELQYFTGVTSLGDHCFSGCYELSSITLPESLTSLGNNCFSDCSSLTSITIPVGVTSLGDMCFEMCSLLTSITLPESVTNIGSGCFSMTALTSVTIPESVTNIGAGCFSMCSSLSSITLPESLTSLGDNCFYDCTSLSSITLPVGLTSIGGYCFYDCTSLSSITLPAGVTSLGEGCFQMCMSISSITLPAGVTSLGEACFQFCDALTSITIPESVTNIGAGCFADCYALTLATVLPATPPSLGVAAFDYVSNIKVRSAYVDDYKTATNWIIYSSIISAI